MSGAVAVNVKMGPVPFKGGVAVGRAWVTIAVPAADFDAIPIYGYVYLGAGQGRYRVVNTAEPSPEFWYIGGSGFAGALRTPAGLTITDPQFDQIVWGYNPAPAAGFSVWWHGYSGADPASDFYLSPPTARRVDDVVLIRWAERFAQTGAPFGTIAPAPAADYEIVEFDVEPGTILWGYATGDYSGWIVGGWEPDNPWFREPYASNPTEVVVEGTSETWNLDAVGFPEIPGYPWPVDGMSAAVRRRRRAMSMRGQR